MRLRGKSVVIILPISILLATVLIIVIGTIIGNISLANTSHNVEEHTYLEATCTKPKTCMQCNATQGEALGHTGGTHINGGICTRCNVQYQTHTMYATYTANGNETHNRKCTTCNYVETSTHNYIDNKCQQCGYITVTTNVTDTNIDNNNLASSNININNSSSSNINTDNTQSSTKLPQTGESSVIIVAIISFVLISCIAIIKLRQYRDII